MTPRAQELCDWLRDYASTRINSLAMDERRTIPPYVVLDLGNRGILGACASEAHGGLGLAPDELLAVFQQLGAIDLTVAIFAGIHNALGIRPISRAGSPALADELVPQLATGRMLGAFAMTEPAAGSNARGLETLAVADGDGWRLRGTKIWVGNGSWAGAINVIARRPPGEGGGTCAFTVRAGTRGLRMGAEAPTTGMRAIVQNDVFLDDVHVTRGELLGTAGEGFAVAEDSFGLARFGISAIALGGMRRSVQLALRYAERRSISTGRLVENGHARSVLGSMVGATTAAAALLDHTAARFDSTGAAPPHLSAICKIVIPELLGQVADRATQLLGGRGYLETSELPRIVRDARLFRIFEGPTETLAMHLGSAVLGKLLSIETLFAGLGTPPHLAPLVDELAARITDTGDARVRSGERVKVALGELVAAAVLAAVAEHRPGVRVDDRGGEVVGHDVATLPAVAEHRAGVRVDEHRVVPHDVAVLASRWASADLARRTARLVAELDVPLVDMALLSDAHEAFREQIGEVEQTLPGMSDALDPMLRR